MKVLLIVFVGVSSLLLAMNQIRQCNFHIKAINQCIMMIEKIEILLSYNILSVKEIFKILSDNHTYNLLSFIIQINENMETKNCNYILSEDNIRCIKSNLYLKLEDKENLINYFSLLGKSDLNGQILNCKTYKEVFKKRLNFIEENEKSQSKSMSVLIAGIGFLISILLL